jgi:hypothetical protein
MYFRVQECHITLSCVTVSLDYRLIFRAHEDHNLSDMQPETSASRANASETKARGANRSTKLAGKLKVLPEESELTAPGQRLGAPVPPKDQGERLENTADSEDGDDEEEEEEDEDDVKVCIATESFRVLKNLSA